MPMDEPSTNRQGVPGVLIVAAALGWFGLIALQFIDPSAPDEGQPALEDSQEVVETTQAQDLPPSLLDTLDEDQRTSVLAEFGTDERAEDEEASSLVLALSDVLTGEPAPELRVRLSDANGSSEELRSDASGKLHSMHAWRTAEIQLEILGEGGEDDLIQSSEPSQELLQRTFQVELPEPSAAPLEVRVELPLGPTFELELLGAPPGLAAHELEAVLSSANAKRAFDKARALGRAGDTPWLRFAPQATLVSPGPPWRLTLVSDDGLWSGSAEVDTIVGRAASAVTIDLTPRARLHGVLRDGAGQPVPSSFVQLWPPGASFQQAENRPLFRPTDEQGRFDFPALEPGPYALKVELRDHLPHEQALQMVAGQTTELGLDLRLDDGRPRGSVRGRVVSRSGTYSGPVTAALRLDDPPSVLTRVVTWNEEDGRSVGNFEFEEIGAAEVQLSVFGQDLFEVAPAVQLTSPLDVGQLEFTVLDDVPAVELRFEARAAEGRSAVAVFQLQVELLVDGVSRRASLSTEQGAVTLRGMPPGANYEYRLRADGHATLWGAGVAPLESQSEVLAPSRGVGLEVLVQGPDGQPLEGATVLFDGLEVGRCDARGRLHLNVESAPERMRVEHGDWVPAAASKLRPDGSWEAWQERVSVVLEPPA